jgi:hypothetical protein
MKFPKHFTPALSPFASDANAEREKSPEATLAAVRELSENATLRPAPRGLRCVPLVPYTAPPAPPAWKFNRELLLSGVRFPLSAFPLSALPQ